MPLRPEQQALVLNLARVFVRQGLGTAPSAPVETSDACLAEPAGCFVSLHALPDRRLRGCVGLIDASQPLLEALRTSSFHVLRDPRFARNPVGVHELALLEIEISVLSAPRPANDPLEFKLLEDGIYLTFGNRSGCFLPQVARETGWTREQLLDRLCIEKMGLPAMMWKHPQARLHVFSVEVIGPEPFETSPVAQIGKHSPHP